MSPLSNTRLTILNLISVFVVGFALTTFLHELAHALAAKMLNIDPILFHSYVSYTDSDVSEINQLYVASAGPLFSLLQSIIFIRLYRSRVRIDFTVFLYLWLAIIGMVVFLGYMMIAPFAPYGDTGRVYAILSIPGYVGLILSAGALTATIYFFKNTTPFIAEVISQLKSKIEIDDKKAGLLFFVMPLVVGTIFNVLISLPAPTPISLVLPFVISLTMIPSVIRLKGLVSSSNKNSLLDVRLLESTYWPVTTMVLMIVISRVLATGIKL